MQLWQITVKSSDFYFFYWAIPNLCSVLLQDHQMCLFDRKKKSCAVGLRVTLHHHAKVESKKTLQEKGMTSAANGIFRREVREGSECKKILIQSQLCPVGLSSSVLWDGLHFSTMDNNTLSLGLTPSDGILNFSEAAFSELAVKLLHFK